MEERLPVQQSLWGEPARRWVAHVDMDAFFASVEQLDDPGLAGRPLIVANTGMEMEELRVAALKARSGPKVEFIRGVRGVVASASYEARVFGVRSAMPLARALVLCPDAIVLPGHFDRYRDVAAHLRRIWGDFSPVVEPMSLDEAYLDMTGCELTGGPIRGIAERLKLRIKDETGLTASVGFGSSKLVAKIASDLDKPDGLVIVPHGHEAATLAPLPIRAIPGVGPRTAEILSQLGISSIGDVPRARYHSLVSVFGAEHAEILLQRAVGIDNDPVQVPGDPKSISNEITLNDDSTDLAFLRSRLRELSDRVAWRLRNDGYMARCVYIKLRLLPGKRSWTPQGSDFARPITRRSTLPVATDAGQEIYLVAERLLKEASIDKGIASGQNVVRLIGVGTSSLVRIENLVLNLPSKGDVRNRKTSPARQREADTAPFASHEKHRKLNASIDHIRTRFGFNAIHLGSASANPLHDDGSGHSE